MSAALATVPGGSTNDAAGSPDALVVPSRLLGPVLVSRDALVAMPAGLYGFEHCRSYALIPAGRDGLWWMQSVEREALIFLLADPFVFFPGHAVDVPPAELSALGATEETVLTAFVIVTLPARDGEGASANLRAPLVLDAERKVARQIVLGDEALSVTAALNL